VGSLLVSGRPRLLFVTPRFPFPLDNGGAIRNHQILTGLKGGHFRVSLLCPAPADGIVPEAELARIADDWRFWALEGPLGRKLRDLGRLGALLRSLPVSVLSDHRRSAVDALWSTVEKESVDVCVLDFVHSAVLTEGRRLPCPSVVFTHNCEAEIFERRAQVGAGSITAPIWRSQHRKMESFERRSLRAADDVIAVSERDAERFRRRYGVPHVSVIPTGVDLDYNTFVAPRGGKRVVFTGSMNWPANIDGIGWLLDEMWADVARRHPQATMTVIGHSPPPALAEKAARAFPGWQFTGRVEDVRPHVHGADCFVIPLRIGGGTRLKGYEAMALGIPVVSTALGVEGLDMAPDVHYLRAETPREFADAIARVLDDAALRTALAERARAHVEARFSGRVVAAEFERICRKVAEAGQRADVRVAA
jgi:glycosyltransferase involved in cell wall biosynthesis